MNSLSEKIEEAWWKLDTNTALGLKLIPTPKEHKNLIGDKQKYLDAAIETVKAYIEGCPEPENPHEPYESMERNLIFLQGAEDFRKALMESLE